MPKPICVKCKKFFRPKKTGLYLTEGRPTSAERVEWVPYKLWSGDLWECRSCGAEIVVGFGASPVRESHASDFNEMRTSLGADQFQVDDC